ncbi:unnamed protein product [Dracunculus medinensis]|uniref:GBD/FH3 domain-containing protein n=1 Tax=Dracunculus medinensis TaxID=318479 RepID=A0A158Q590_DRAME|nr:unnamed protein product [Dracunculus medinensis]
MMRKVAEPILIGSLFSSWKCRKQSKIERNSSNALLKEDNGSQNELKYEKNFHLNQPFDEFDSELKFKLVLKGIYNFASKLDPKKNIVEKSPSSLEKALKMLDCNNEWREKVRWSLTHFCDENDLNCEEEFSRRTSQDVRLNSLLIALNTIIENGYGEELIGQKVLSLLMDLCNLYEETHRNIFINCLKILSNIAVQNKNCAMAIANSGKYALLASL